MRSHRLFLIFLLSFFWISGALAKTNYWYSYVPKQVFATQVFPVTIFSDTDDRKSLSTFEFASESTVRPLNIKPLIATNGGNTFYTFYFKAQNSDIRIPQLLITSKKDVTMLESKYIPVHILDTEGHDEFCGLIATDCKIITSQVSEFDADSNLVSLTIKAAEANPEDIQMSGSIESGIEKITKTDSDTIIEYFFVIPSSQKIVVTSYYNTLQQRFISKTISTDYKNKPVAAQENLNPKDSSFDKLKKYGLFFFSLFFLWMFWRRKEIFFLVLLAICVIILLTMYTPHEKICVQEGAPLYILPTKTSTTGGRINNTLTTDILNKRGDYYKIEYDHNMIGWIKHEDTCKD